MIKVYVVVRKDNQQYVRVFRTREGAELFLQDFRVEGEIVEDEIAKRPSE